MNHILINTNAIVEHLQEMDHIQNQLNELQQLFDSAELVFKGRADDFIYADDRHNYGSRNFHYKDGYINFDYSVQASGGDVDWNDSMSIPVEFFIEPDRGQAVSNYQKYLNKKKEENYLREIKERQIQAEKKEREEYERLKAKFGNNKDFMTRVGRSLVGN